jgi:outer membrane protein assembly factor BamD
MITLVTLAPPVTDSAGLSRSSCKRAGLTWYSLFRRHRVEDLRTNIMANRPGTKHFVRHLLVAAVSASALLIGACSSDDEEVEYKEAPVEDLYNSALDSLEGGEYVAATKLFDEVERQHPYSPWATKAQIMAAYAYYQANQYDEAVAALERFIQLHPANPDVPYAHYLTGLCYYERISDPARDQEMTQEARRVFSELMARYPDSKYARDAQVKLDLANDHLAAKEMVVGRYYLRQRHYLAAINRFKTVIDNYQTTTHTPEALHRLVEAYRALGLDDEAQKMAALLGHNFPGSEWYLDSYTLVEDGTVRPSEKSWYEFW